MPSPAYIRSFFTNRYFLLVLALIINIAFTLFNGYPILYSDTSTYISSGFELETPFDRPITYGILLRLFSLGGFSFMLVPVFQTLIFMYVLYQVLSIFLEDVDVAALILPLIIVLSLFTGFNWSINQLLPDFFTSIGFLSLICLFFRSRTIKKDFLLWLLFFLAAASHISNVFVYVVVLFGILFFKNNIQTVNDGSFKRKWLFSFVLLAVAYVIMASAISKSRQIFFAGSMAQKGILQEVLKDHCNDTDFKLCKYKDSIPQSFEYFVWKEESPLYKIGGWKVAKPELKEIIDISFNDSKYISMQLKSTFLYFLKQLVSFDIGEGNGPFTDERVLIQRIKKYSVLDSELCDTSMQSESAFLELEPFNYYYRIVTGISFIVFLVLFFLNYHNLTDLFRTITYLLFLLLLASSLLVAFSSEVSNRHGCKLIWMITFLNFILIYKWISSKKNPSVSS